jgi:hypothetical protein
MGRDLKLTTHPLIPVQENADICFHSPINLHGVVINYLIIGTVTPGVKRTGLDADHSTSNTGVKKTWIYISTPHKPSWNRN